MKTSRTNDTGGVSRRLSEFVHLRPLLADEEGVRLAEGVAKAKTARIKRRQKHTCELEIVLDEGRNREVRRLLARIGHKVLRLKRVAIGPLKLGLMTSGEFRKLRPDEVSKLRRLGQPKTGGAKPATPKRTGAKKTSQRAKSGRVPPSRRGKSGSSKKSRATR